MARLHNLGQHTSRAGGVVPDQPARLFLCARCHCQVLVCSRCDRGQRYCASGCSAVTRQARQREAGQRYQQGRAGRFHHAARTRRWRQRRAIQAKIVTHHGSQAVSGDAVLPDIDTQRAIAAAPMPCPATPTTTATATLSKPHAGDTVSLRSVLWRCHWCHAPCRLHVRQGFLRHHRREPDHGHHP
jgi:hypothetical protein